MPGITNQVLTVAQMRAAEQALIDAGTTVGALMERAGQGAAEYAWRLAAGRAVTVLCGPGNNGGDGYVIAETLRARGIAVRVVAPLEPATQAARDARAACRGPVQRGGDGAQGALLVDCLFGSGLTRGLSGQLAELLATLAARHDLAMAVDLPSGVESDSGAVLSPVPAYALTVALGAWKRAHWAMPASALMGERRLVGIGIAPVAGAARLAPVPRLRTPAADAHKYRRGLLAVIAGEMPGAALLASTAAMHGEAGYVKLLSAHSHPAAPADLVIDDRDTETALADHRIAAVLVGPGLGTGDAAAARLQAALSQGKPLVLDADALTMLTPAMIANRSSPAIATPHEGELARMEAAFGLSGEGAKAERAAALSHASGLHIVAKGPDTVIALPDGGVMFVPPASPWLSVAGTGDVLAGLIASRLAAGSAPADAAREGAALHAGAAAIAGPVLTASTLVAAIPRAYAALS